MSRRAAFVRASESDLFFQKFTFSKKRNWLSAPKSEFRLQKVILGGEVGREAVHSVPPKIHSRSESIHFSEVGHIHFRDPVEFTRGVKKVKYQKPKSESKVKIKWMNVEKMLKLALVQANKQSKQEHEWWNPACVRARRVACVPNAMPAGWRSGC